MTLFARVLRILFAVCLLGVAGCCIWYGLTQHNIDVQYEETEEITYEVMVPVSPQDPMAAMMMGGMPPDPMMMGGAPFDGGGFGDPGAEPFAVDPMDPGFDPGMPGEMGEIVTSPEQVDPSAPYAMLGPQMETKTETETVTKIVTETWPEWKVITEVTIGGLALQDDTIIRTYTGEAPALCPT